jgi:hypothetical protein
LALAGRRPWFAFFNLCWGLAIDTLSKMGLLTATVTVQIVLNFGRGKDAISGRHPRDSAK